MKINDVLYLTIFASLLITSCKNAGNSSEDTTTVETETPYQVVIEAEDFTDASDDYQVIDGDVGYVEMSSKGWLLFDVSVERAGRYQSQVFVSVDNDTSSVWIQDYIGNPDGRTYNITGSIPVMVNADFQQFSVDGSPLNDTIRMMKIHTHGNNLKIDKIVFELIKDHQVTPVTLTQNMDGDEWQLAWSDEFDGDELDTTKWIYDIGNWGWGNNELQYYTEGRTENARLENGVLIIEARKNDMGQEWTSARLTTRGKQSFLYGKIELKARVPRARGNWAAGWTLGDTYVDELSWPYCGEIDILESVGYEVDDETGDGRAHCTMHTPAYYFKINNQISGVKDVKNIAGEFHTYAVEWTPTEIRGYVDDEHYYTYDKNANAKEWPFNIPQNIIVNLAMGGGWGGAQGMDPDVTSQIYEIDYVRVYQLM